MFPKEGYIDFFLKEREKVNVKEPSEKRYSYHNNVSDAV